MKLPTIGAYTSQSIGDIISYLKRLVTQLQSYIDKNNNDDSGKYITKVNIKSGWLTVTYGDGTQETHKIDMG